MRAEAHEQECTAGIPILMYHSIAESGPPELSRFRVSPQKFQDHLRVLRRHDYYSISLGEWVCSIKNGEPLLGHPVVITFDDGYSDLITNAAPLLEAAGFRATIFVVAGKVGETADWDKTSWPPLPLMAWDDIRDLQRRGFEIGNHSLSHADLTTLSEEEILNDCRQGRAILSQKLNCDVDITALPWGRTDARVRIALARAGIRAAVTTEGGLSSLSCDPLFLPRIEITGDDDADSFAHLLKIGRRPAASETLQPKFAPDANIEFMWLRERLRAAEKDAALLRVGAEETGLRTEIRAEQGDATQERLTQVWTRLQAIESSTTWRITAPFRYWFSTKPRLARCVRRSLKLIWWTATLQLPRKAREWLQGRTVSRTCAPFLSKTLLTENPMESLSTSTLPGVDRAAKAIAAPSLTFTSLGASLLADIPMIVCSFNNPTYLRRMIAQLRQRNLNNIIVFDSNSNIPEMQEYLYRIAKDTKVVRLSENVGPRHLFLSKSEYRWLPDIFCFTDPDLAFGADLPGDFLQELAELTERFRVGKVGLAIDITDRSAMHGGRYEICGAKYKIWEWEQQFWREEIGRTGSGDPIFRANVDTTFALYNKRRFDCDSFLDAVRVAGRFTCRHLPWYRDSGMADAELENYRATQKFSTYLTQSDC